MFRLERNVVGIECFAQGSRHGKFCGRRTQQLSRDDEGKSSSVVPDSRDFMMPSALSNSSDSSSRDFSFIQSSSGAWSRSVSDASGDPRAPASCLASVSSYGGGGCMGSEGARRRIFAGGRGRLGVPV